ncbi:MAG: SPOR domain-containing protein [Gammaproteobacteria bacterium]|nr:SPOR domain-containing protein [Gammaproteobacteria bacterium]
MIKIAFYFLIVVNSGLLAWQLWFKDDGSALLSDPINNDLPSIKLVKEVKVSSRSSKHTPSKSSFDCLTLGPFVDRQESQSALAWLSDRDAQAHQRVEKESKRLGFWVHLKKFDSRSEANDVVERLKSDGFDDVYVETDGDVRNTVSLGLFREYARAQDRVATLRDLGVDPVIAEKHRDNQTYWVDFWRLPDNDALSDEALSNFDLISDRIVRATSSEQCDKKDLTPNMIQDLVPGLPEGFLSQ